MSGDEIVGEDKVKKKRIFLALSLFDELLSFRTSKYICYKMECSNSGAREFELQSALKILYPNISKTTENDIDKKYNKILQELQLAGVDESALDRDGVASKDKMAIALEVVVADAKETISLYNTEKAKVIEDVVQVNPPETKGVVVQFPKKPEKTIE